MRIDEDRYTTALLAAVRLKHLAIGAVIDRFAAAAQMAAKVSADAHFSPGSVCF
jgi:hypothetical protein